MPFRPDAILLTTAEAASLLEVTPAWVRRLVTKDFIEKRGKDRFTLEAVIKGYIRFLKDETRKSSKTVSSTRVQDARATEIEFRTAERERTLMATDEAREVFAEWAGVIRAGFNSLPARVTDDLDERRRIESEIDDILGEATSRFEQAIGHRPAADRAAEAASEDDA